MINTWRSDSMGHGSQELMPLLDLGKLY